MRLSTTEDLKGGKNLPLKRHIYKINVSQLFLLFSFTPEKLKFLPKKDNVISGILCSHTKITSGMFYGDISVGG